MLNDNRQEVRSYEIQYDKQAAAIASLESIGNMIERLDSKCVEDRSSIEIINVVVSNAEAKVGMEAHCHNQFQDQVSLEDIKGKITAIGKAAWRTLVKLWNTITKFAKAIYNFIKKNILRIRSKDENEKAAVAEVVEMAEQIKKDRIPKDKVKVVEDTEYVTLHEVSKVAVPNRSILVTEAVTDDGGNEVKSTTPVAPQSKNTTTYNATMRSVDDHRAKFMGKAILVPKEVVVKMAEVVKEDPPEVLLDMPYGSVLLNSGHADDMDDSRGVRRVLGSTLDIAITRKIESFELLNQLQEALIDEYRRSKERDATNDKAQVQYSIKSHQAVVDNVVQKHAQSINDNMMDGNFMTGGWAMYGLVLDRNRPLHPNDSGQVKQEVWFDSKSFKTSFIKPDIKPGKVTQLTVKDIRYLRGLMVENLEEYEELVKKNDRVLSFDLSKYQSEDPVVSWYAGWIVKIQRFSSQADEYLNFYSKYINMYLDHCMGLWGQEGNHND